MYYKKIKTEHTTIEFHNNWLGVETVIINGQAVSKKSSFMGTDHYFSIIENGHSAHYMLTTKIDSLLQVYIDLRRNGTLIEENIPIPYGAKPSAPRNKFKRLGIKKLNEYAIKEAIEELKKGLNVDNQDPEIYFYLACGYSIEEKALKGFECLKKAAENKLQNLEVILNHEMLAYLRMQEAFEEFFNSNFTEFDESKISDEEQE